MSTAQLFSAFPPVSFETWKAKLEAELRGKSFESLFTEPEPGLRMSPYIHPDLGPKEVPGPLNQGRSDNNWAVTVQILSADPVQAHGLAMEALTGGVECIWIVLPHRWEVADFALFLKGIHLDMIQLQVTCTGSVADQWHNFEALQTHLTSSYPAAGLSVLWGIDALQWIQAGYIDQLADSCRFCNIFPGSKIMAFSRTDGILTPTRQLATLLLQAEEVTRVLHRAGVDPALSIGAMHFFWPSGRDFFLELASIRAFHILWANYLQARGMAPQQAPITAFQNPDSLDLDSYQNMITASTQSMSAVMGGVQRLLVLPSDIRENLDGTEFSRRVARNLQHVLRYEAFLDKVVDPAAGSRLVEQWTAQIAQTAWQFFQESVD